MGDVLTDMKRTKDHLVCIDSDGCLLDNMELKHKECFCPAVVNVWNLQGASKYVREVHEWVNLYSRSRGWNRFPAVVRTLELSYARPELKERGYIMPNLKPLKKWIEETPVLSAVAIDEYARKCPDCDPLLLQAAQWSREVDANIAHIVRNILPFPGVREAVLKLREFADVVVVSATPHDSLVRELTAVGIAPLMTAIAGQELGTKSQSIRKAMSHGYAADHVLKIGDAPSDYEAARDNGVLFNPIVAGKERDSWNNVLEVSSVKFRNGTFKGEYQDEILKDFFATLAEEPHWKIS
ncbi:MAG: HAD family hydrolase [Sphaerochaeta sp.]|jgi:phosphoglycolate phosphatase-like HAD superfamily hydrolase|nr:HAD hydrolase-like protein [Sphaerochaeta sp.]